MEVTDILVGGKRMNPNLTPEEFLQLESREKEGYSWGAFQMLAVSMTDRANSSERRNRRNTSFSLFAAGFVTAILPFIDYLMEKISFEEMFVRGSPVVVPAAIVFWINFKVWMVERKRCRTDRDATLSLSIGRTS